MTHSKILQTTSIRLRWYACYHVGFILMLCSNFTCLLFSSSLHLHLFIFISYSYSPCPAVACLSFLLLLLAVAAVMIVGAFGCGQHWGFHGVSIQFDLGFCQRKRLRFRLKIRCLWYIPYQGINTLNQAWKRVQKSRSLHQRVHKAQTSNCCRIDALAALLRYVQLQP